MPFVPFFTLARLKVLIRSGNPDLCAVNVTFAESAVGEIADTAISLVSPPVIVHPTDAVVKI